ncbi:hypothetical protein T01_13466 [Trichinella spiralis]|uniref:Uncharacterized protein n=1 Tax=Trichinella spiralis TaxID=6334 RepID=A0A0V0Z3C3_TRISP|nr:hypothetical protein T01_13466 [Trichinella spiralis]
MTAGIQSRELRKTRRIASTSANCTDQFLITSINSLSS